VRKLLEVGLIISAFDKASRVINDVTGNANKKLTELEKRQQKSEALMMNGAKVMAAGAGILATLDPAIEAYENLEDASASLRSTMMKDGGVISANFEKVNKLAVQLGNKLPGNTKDFTEMMQALLRNGVTEQSILQGTGKAAANLAVVLKVPYAEGARMAAKLKEATGVADKEMLGFMDTIQRVVNVGVDAGEMQYAFSRSAGMLKLLGVQGLGASKAMSAVYAMLIKTGASGETAGTNMAKLMEAFMDASKTNKLKNAAGEYGIAMDFIDHKTGKFKGIENMVAQFDKLKGLNPQQRANVTAAFVGPGMDGQFMNTLIDGGVGKFNEMQQRMAAQATLEQKVGEQLKTLKALKEAAAGTFENALAAMGESIGPELKMLADFFGKASEMLQTFAAAHPKVFKFIGLFIAFVGVATMVVGAIMLIKGAVMGLQLLLMANPIILIIAAIAAAALLIYINWAPIKSFFIKTWAAVTASFVSMKNKIMGMGSAFYNAGKNIVKQVWEGIKSFAHKPVEAIAGITQKMRDFLPFSPAKAGAFRDLHKVKIVETMISGMKTGPAVQAMRQVTGAAMNAANTGLGGARGPASGGGTTLHFSPTINVSGGSGPAVQQGVQNATEALKAQFMQWYREAERNKARTSYSF
jgi:TP901 family phage tail tape measure protein